MKLIYITSTFPFGKNEAFLMPEINELVRRGHEVTIIPVNPKGKIRTDLNNKNIKILKNSLLSLEMVVQISKFILKRPNYIVRALKLTIGNNIRITIKNLAILPKAVWVAYKCDDLNYSHIHAHWSSTTSSMAMIINLLTDIPWSFTAHRWDIVENNKFAQKSAKAKMVRYISESGYNMAKEMQILNHANSIILHMGVELPLESKDINVSRTKFRIACVANMVPVKGHVYLLDAIAQLNDPSVELWLIGHGELEDLLKEKVVSLNLQSRVKFIGQIPHIDILQLYRRGDIDVVILPSIDLGNGLHEGIPVSLIEAMSYGIPVISTRTGGIPELLANDAGVIINPESPSDIIDAITLLKLDSKVRHKIGISGLERVKKEFSIKNVVSILEYHFSEKE